MRAHISSSNAAGGMLWATWSLTRHEHEGKGSLDLLARGPEQDLVHEYPLFEAEAEHPPFLPLRDRSFARDVRDTDPLVP
jgi:hypothetical protein